MDAGCIFALVAEGLFIVDAFVRVSHNLFTEGAVEGFSCFYSCCSAFLCNSEHQESLMAWVGAVFQRGIPEIGARIEHEFGHTYAGRSVFILLRHSLRLTRSKLEFISCKLNVN
jgi:hypothetical protein